jgi:hypothetical protein
MENQHKNKHTNQGGEGILNNNKIMEWKAAKK